ncbi:MAG: SRPBCC family protein [Ferruginibacter sp.]
MKIIKNILLVIVSLIVLALIIALFLPKDMSAEREITINKPKKEVFDYIKNLRNQPNYSKWAMLDPEMKKDFRGTDGAVGSVFAWDSEKGDVGKGEQEIKKIAEGERLDFELRFIKPFESTAAAYMTTEAVDSSQTKVKWGFNGKMSYPFNIFRLFMDPEKAVGDDFSTGLARLKDILEK